MHDAFTGYVHSISTLLDPRHRPDSYRTDRELRVAREVIARFGLNLSGMNVATEAATGHFRWTPLLAVMAGARSVVAVGSNSRFGSGTDACHAVAELATETGTIGELELTTDVSSIDSADILTNLRALRPLDARRFEMLRPGTAVPLMCETWEYRERDLDLAAAFSRDLLVLGTNEHHPSLKFMRYVGLLALRLTFDAGIEVYRSKIVVVGGGAFGNSVSFALHNNGADVRVVCPASEQSEIAQQWIGESLRDTSVRDFLSDADLLVFADYTTKRCHIGNDALPSEGLISINPSIRIVHISGLIDAHSCREAGIKIVPDVIPTDPRTMSVTTALLGARPVIELHAAGLKVGEICVRAWREARGKAPLAREIALRNPLCQEFPEGILQRFNTSHSNDA